MRSFFANLFKNCQVPALDENEVQVIRHSRHPRYASHVAQATHDSLLSQGRVQEAESVVSSLTVHDLTGPPPSTTAPRTINASLPGLPLRFCASIPAADIIYSDMPEEVDGVPRPLKDLYRVPSPPSPPPPPAPVADEDFWCLFGQENEGYFVH
uniref:Uncharacterized protein n=1 Tax=Chromera velia CCMP2878 TaxID=1169474 RepID=A0A0G4IDL3_9ALVE|eukprot:Cvel_13411.t1-p1 / transcript=Cvel_13411.t1 / gene=Cvel_13411 / organism=Chromera_velia_CCMP2878 / gene_product=hypothetical protein / transcript_product=hypothetical protein / location=Cvel_scaffold914:43008-43466(+) / protein_length=153 / sequence_SO=supercontig / SO=protein_coding / is_pseudo=false